MEKIFIPAEPPIAFHRELAKAFGGIQAALYLQQLIYWSSRTKRADGYFYKSKAEIEEETTVSRYHQDKIRNEFEALGVLSVKKIKANGSPTLHYRLNSEKINEILKSENSLMEKRTVRFSITETTTTIAKAIGADAQQAPKKEDSITKEIYKVFRHYALVIENNRHVPGLVQKLVETHGEVVAMAYLVRLQERDLRTEQDKHEFVPQLRHYRDVVGKSTQVINYYKRTKPAIDPRSYE